MRGVGARGGGGAVARVRRGGVQGRRGTLDRGMMHLADIYDARVADGSLRADPAQSAVLPEFQRIATALTEAPPKRGLFGRRAAPEPVRGLYLWGGVGTGKSMLMDLFAAHAPAPTRRVHFHAFMQEVHDGMNAARKRGVDDAIAPVAEAIAAELRCLAFDEMQITDIADAMIVGRLFQRLFAAGVAVVTTSNRPPDDLYKDGLNRAVFLPFIALIKAHMTVWKIEATDDYRQGRLADVQTYFCPADAEARAAIDAIWAGLTGAEGEPEARTEARLAGLDRGVALERDAGLVLRIKGREVMLPRFRNGVARVSFWDLCGAALGPADYLAVAQAVRVLILEGVPQMDQSNFNAARRFVTLVDALYEAGVRLVISAAEEPERLYLEGAGSFEFERTASRLREMQGSGWCG